VAVVAIGGLLLRTDAPKDATRPRRDARAPDFAAFTLDSPPARRTLADYAGQAVILNVWATWCDPCREEMPSFERLYRDYKSRGLRIVAVSIDDRGATQLVRDFVGEHGLTFDVLQDPRSDIMSDFAVRGVPETFLISRSGQIVARRYVADWDAPLNRKLVDSLLALPLEDSGR
jgi:cytochrome c-type biogenesis protein